MRATLLLRSLACAAILSGGGTGVEAQSSSDGVNLDDIETIFAFGDSYSWNGYTPLLGVNNIPGYGLTTSGGYNWLQFLSQLGSTPITLYDLAASGATTNNSVISAPATDFVNQVGLWNDWFAPGTGTYTSAGQVRWETNSTLFTVWIGINDVGAPYDAQTDFPQQLSEIFSSYNAAVASLYAAGARNLLILGVPPTWRTPLIQAYNDSRVGVYQDRVGQYNVGLTQLFNTFAPSYPDASFRLYDTIPFFNTILDRPADYGFTVTDRACAAYEAVTNQPEINVPECGAPLSDFVWWNTYHPAWPVHELLASVIGGVLAAPDTTPATTLTSAQGSLPTSASTAGGTAATSSSSSSSTMATAPTADSASASETASQGSASGSVGPSASASGGAGGSSAAGPSRPPGGRAGAAALMVALGVASALFAWT